MSIQTKDTILTCIAIAVVILFVGGAIIAIATGDPHYLWLCVMAALLNGLGNNLANIL